MIWQYLKQDITASEADAAYELVEGNVAKIKKAYLKKSKNEVLLREIECRGRKDLLEITEKDCFKLAVNTYKTLNMDDKSRKELIARLESEAAKDSVRIQAEPYSEKAYMPYSSNTILDMFMRTTAKHRRDNLNISLSKKFIDHMFSKEASSWKKFALIKRIINDDKLDKLQESILLINPDNVGSDSNFLLALSMLKHSKEEQAMRYFKASKKTYLRKMSIDKNLFWMYQVSNDRKYLEELALSMDINIYSLYAKEMLNVNVDNYFSSLNVTDKNSDLDLCDPFVWNKITQEIKNTPRDELFKLANKYNQKDMISVQSFIIEKSYAFKKHSYIMPYDEHLEELTNDDKAIVYALMRQESNLIPSALSRSFALGLMQLMPFVTDDLSTRINNPISCYNDMFNPEYNIRYALKHLKWLKGTYYHPLFIAYSYNGGLGFLKRHLETGTFTEGKYEPFISMELMSNKESREYGKRVLSNYVMYKKILGENVSIVDLLNTLTNPKRTDRYRSAKLAHQ